VPWPYFVDFDGDGDLDVLTQPMNYTTGQGSIDIRLNPSIHRAACPSPLTFQVGIPAPGNQAFAVSVAGATPGSVGFLGLSLGAVSSPPLGGPCQIWIDASPGQLFPPLLGFADATGRISFPIPIPNASSLIGAKCYAQWLVLDPVQGNILTESRRILIW
jgi:hypothetical protein